MRSGGVFGASVFVEYTEMHWLAVIRSPDARPENSLRD